MNLICVGTVSQAHENILKGECLVDWFAGQEFNSCSKRKHYVVLLVQSDPMRDLSRSPHMIKSD